MRMFRAVSRYRFRIAPKFLIRDVNSNRPSYMSTLTNGADSFGVSIFDKPSFKKYIENAVKSYQSNKSEVDRAMSEILREHKLVLFMEGTVDAPKSLCSSNVVKMFTLLQITGIHTLDLLTNKEALGYLTSNLNEPARTILFKDGVPIGGHDELLELFKSGKLLQALGVAAKKFSDTASNDLSNMLPIANY